MNNFILYIRNKSHIKKAFKTILATLVLIGLSLSYTSLTYAKKNKNDSYTTNITTPAPIDIDCKAYVLMDLESGQILYEKNADKKVYPASTTKIMTSILALETLQPNSIVTVSQDAIDGIGPGGMNIGCMAGEEFKFKDIIKAVLLTSANECAYAIAENSAGTHDEFINWMNSKAKEIGANSTNFANVHGMFLENHYTTARNLAAIARYAMVQSPASSKFRKIVKKDSYTLKPTNKHSEWYPYALPITNKLRSYPSKYYNKVLGVKTGYISKSGMNFVGAVKGKDGRELLSVICGVNPASAISVFKYTQMLLDEGFKNFDEERIVDSSNRSDTLTLENLSGIKNDVTVTANGSVRALFEKSDSSAEGKVNISKEYSNDISVPLKKGTVVGTLTASYNGQTLGVLDISVNEDIPYDFSGYIRTITIIYILLALVFVSGLVALGYMSKSRNPLDEARSLDAAKPLDRAKHLDAVQSKEKTYARHAQLSASERAKERIRAKAAQRRSSEHPQDK